MFCTAMAISTHCTYTEASAPLVLHLYSSHCTADSVVVDRLICTIIHTHITGQLPIKLNFEEVPDHLYKYDTSPPPPIPPRVSDPDD